MEYLVARWEQNGYHDSYFYAAIWDGEKLIEREEGATAYGGWSPIQAPKINENPEELKAFRAWAARRAAEIQHDAYMRDALEPQSVKDREELVTIRNCKHKGQTIIAGSIGRVFWSGAYGKFYAKGYNKPNRSNIRVGLELTSGEKVFVALSACKRLVSVPSVEELEAWHNAAWEAHSFSVVGLTSCRAWLSDDFSY